MKRTLEPNWDILLSSFDTSISNTFENYRKAINNYIGSYAYINGHFITTVGLDERRKQCDDILQELQRLVEARERIAQHDIDFIKTYYGL